ncbi:MAG TPA: COX15/CtaA family protein [Polyangia bacterium]|nr:COX15/CtaA family protein [Polyangia bacterium]
MKLQRFAVALACLTFILLIVGALVHNTGSSLACPDWPLCYGQVFPRMVGGILVEHSHRLLAASVGVLTIALLVGMVRRALRDGDRNLIGLGAAALACVIAQGVLGGLTVLYRLPTWTSTAHLGTSMIFFSLVIYIAFRLREPAAEPRAPLAPSVARWTLAAAALIYAQMILGALIRHLGAGLACVELPLCQGHLFPPGAHPYVQLHMLHRLIAVIAFVVVAAASVVTWRAARGRSSARRLALLAPGLVLVQIALGVLSITSFRDLIPLTAHLAVAALILANLWSLHLVARGELGVRAENRAVTLDGVIA